MTNFENVIDRLENGAQNPSTAEITELLKKELFELEKTVALCEKLQRDCDDYWSTLRHGYGYGIMRADAVELLNELAQRGEKYIAVRRELLDDLQSGLYANEFAFSPPLPAACHGDPVRIEYLPENEIFRAEIPGILPFKMSAGVNFLFPKIVYAMQKFTEDWIEQHDALPMIPRAAVIFIYHYANGKQWRTLRDYDNLERSCVLNALQITGLFSDNASRMISVDMMACDTKNFTEVLIIPVKNFVKVLSKLDCTAYLPRGCPE